MQNFSSLLHGYFTHSTSYIQNLSTPYVQKYSEIIKNYTQKSIEYAQKSIERAIPLAKRSQEFCKTHQQLIGRTSLTFCGLYAAYATIRSARMHRMINDLQKRIAQRLLHAGYISTLEWALAHGADINQTFENGKTALHIAAAQGDAERVRQLAAHGATLAKFDELTPCQYPIHYAARNGHIAAIEQLVHAGDDINMALWQAAESGQLETVKWAIQHGANHLQQTQGKQTALDIAHNNRHEKIEKYLLSLRPAQQDDLCIHFTQLLHDAITEQNFYRARMAINSCASLVHIDESQSPLSLTIRPSEGQIPTPFDEIAQVLVEAGVPLHTSDQNGNTPLHIAAIVGNTRLAELFLRFGADATHQNKEYSTALDIALEKGNLDMHRLLERYMSPYQVQAAHKVAQELEQLNKTDEAGNTLLHKAAQTDDIRLASLSLQRQFNPCLYNSFKLTPLDIALEKGNSDMQILLASHMPKHAVQASYERFARKQSAE